MPRPWRSGTIATRGPSSAERRDQAEQSEVDLRDVDRQDEYGDRPAGDSLLPGLAQSVVEEPLRCAYRPGAGPQGELADLVVRRDDERRAGRRDGGTDRRVRQAQGEVASLFRVNTAPSRDFAPSVEPTGTIATRLIRRHRLAPAAAARETQHLVRKSRTGRVVGHDRVGHQRLETELADRRLRRRIDAVDHGSG